MSLSGIEEFTASHRAQRQFAGVGEQKLMPSLQPGKRLFGHWLEYNPAAAESAVEEVQHFLTEKFVK